jgi:hypothetical protein
MRYYALAQGPTPDDGDVDAHPFALVARKWGVGIVDWAFLATKHDLGVPYQVSDALARSVNLEVTVEAKDPGRAIEEIRAVQTCLYARGSMPFSTPILSTHSINDFSNIHGAAHSADDPRHERAAAIWAGAERVRTWPILSPPTVAVPPEASRGISASMFVTAAKEAPRWLEMVAEQPRLRVLEDALLSAPSVPNVGQGILQMWTGLESLFPTVQTEVSFRLALALTQMKPGGLDRVERFKSIRKAYGFRSKVAHGADMRNATETNLAKWTATWQIMTGTVRALLDRSTLPSEEELIVELLASNEPPTTEADRRGTS